MMRSMFSAVSGLKVHQTKMDVIANNIANVNTIGFKSSRVTFADMFSQTLTSASRANDNTGKGGTNPSQIGLGAKLNSIDIMFSQGAAQRTDNSTDLMIEGDSFFIVGDGSGKYFTRAGAFNFDLDGNLVNSAGLRVHGWDAVPDPDNPGSQKIQKGPVAPIKITADEKYASPTQTKNVTISGNLKVEDSPITSNVTVYDSLGNEYKGSIIYTYESATDDWKVELDNKFYRNGDTSTIYWNESNPTSPPNPPNPPTSLGRIKFNADGEVDFVTPNVTDVTELDLSVLQGNFKPQANIGDSSKVKLDISGMTQFGKEKSSVTAQNKDGNPPGTLKGVSIDQDGIVRATYTNGAMKTLAQIAVADFENPAGLESIGGSLFVATANSGEFDGMGLEVGSGGGRIVSGTLEMSNVDLSLEFTEMITTQRGFQANSRVITTSDDMLQELVNLKR